MGPTGRRALPLAAVLSLLAASPARAQPEVEIARKYFELGQSLYNRADYEGALKQFSEAYRLARRPGILFNLGRCHENLGQYEQAIGRYEEYLRSAPADAEAVRSRVSNLRQLGERRRAEQERRDREQRDAVLRQVRPQPESFRKAGWIVGLAGVTVAALGGTLLGLARWRQGQVEADFRNALEYSSFRASEEQGRAFSTSGVVLTVVGGAAAVTGAVLLVLYHRGARTERAVAITPLIMADGATLSAGLRF